MRPFLSSLKFELIRDILNTKKSQSYEVWLIKVLKFIFELLTQLYFTFKKLIEISLQFLNIL